METKVCKRCQNELPITEFYFRKESGKYRDACKKCKSVVTKEEKKQIAELGIKKCKTCGIDKPVSEYILAGGGKWLQPYCKPCDAERKRLHREKNLERIRQKSKERYEKTKKLVPLEQKIINRKEAARKMSEYHKRTRIPMSEEEKKRRKRENGIKYRLKHKDSLKERKKKYTRTEEAKRRIREKIAEQMKDVGFRVKKNLRGRVYVALKRGCKSLKTMELLGCTIDEFKVYFESKFTEGMSWEKYMEGGIHIDHIVPCIAFDLTKEEEQRKCFHYTNLQPLWALDNLRKGVSLNFKNE
jgi:hypothetical protein